MYINSHVDKIKTLKVAINPLGAIKDDYVVNIDHDFDNITIFFKTKRDLINFKNQVIQQFELLERNSNV